MRSTAILLLAALGFTALVAAPPKTDQEIEAYLETLRAPGRFYANIDTAEGAWLRDLTKSLKVKRALEIGTSTGYSGIWIALGLRDSGGKLVTLEISARRHAQAQENFRATGLEGLIEARLGNALAEVPKVEGPFDLVFIDAAKPDYLKYYQMVLPKMRRGGAIVAHNVANLPHAMSDFLERIKTDPAVRTEFANPGTQGFSVSYVK
jgi:predicted O-methyltransferase YrrM